MRYAYQLTKAAPLLKTILITMLINSWMFFCLVKFDFLFYRGWSFLSTNQALIRHKFVTPHVGCICDSPSVQDLSISDLVSN